MTRARAAAELAATLPDVAEDLRAGCTVAACRSLVDWHDRRRFGGRSPATIDRARLVLSLVAAAERDP